ncbi:MAG: DUF4197 domain-containing protein [Thermodesulfobacteriota bacterium]
MKNYLAVISAFLVIFTWLASAEAKSSWWDKGVNILNDVHERSGGAITTEPSYAEIGEAFKQALRIGSENVVSQLGSIDGFNHDPSIHIPLPEELHRIKKPLARIGMSKQVDDLELKLNRAAEYAVPKAKDLFLQAITEMTFDDIKNIYAGPEDSATKYFQRKMSSPLKKEMRPIVTNTLSQVGAIQAYDKVIGKYKSLPFMPDVKANLEEHVIQKGLEGIFYYLAKEEAAIRNNPAKQTTILLKKVFGVK